MGLFNFLKKSKKQSTADIARERLQIIVAHQRLDRAPEAGQQPVYLAQLQKEIMEVIKKHVAVNADQIKVELSQNDDSSILELNVTLPDAK